MTDNVKISDLDRIEILISTLSDAVIDTGQPYLLSKLGKDLGEDLRRLKEITGKPLAQFLVDRFSDKYALVMTGAHNNVQAIVRAVDGELANKDVPVVEKAQSTRPRFNYRFWAAFSVPLISGRRYLNREDFLFRDLENKPAGNFIEIEREYIAPEEIDDRNEIIKDNIEKWIRAHGFRIDDFTMRSPRKESKATVQTGGRTALDLVIEALDAKQLANTSLSMDVVASLLRKRV